MIDLTPLEVRKKKGDFRRGIRGYDQPQVDEFLDVVADRLDQLVRESMALKEKVGRLEQQVTDFRAREKALTEALVSAQELREDMKTQVAREADLARRQAEQEVETIRGRAEQLREQEEATLQRLRGRQLQIVQTYREFLQRELSDLSSIEEAIDLNDGLDELPVERRRPRRPAPRASRKAATQDDAKEASSDESEEGADDSPGEDVRSSAAQVAEPAPSRGAVNPPGRRKGAPQAEPPSAGTPAAEAVTDDDDPSAWIDELLSQPALKPVRPPPLAAPIDIEAEPMPDSELMLSNDDVVDGTDDGVATADAEDDDSVDDLWDGTLGIEDDVVPGKPEPETAASPTDAVGDAEDDLLDTIDELIAGASTDAKAEVEEQVTALAAPSAVETGDNEMTEAPRESEPEEVAAAIPAVEHEVEEEPIAAAADPATGEEITAALGAEEAEGAPETDLVEAVSEPEPAAHGLVEHADADVGRVSASAAADEAGGSKSPFPEDDDRDPNLGLSLVAERGSFQDFGDFSDLQGSADFGLLPEFDGDGVTNDVSGLTLRGNSGEKASNADGEVDDLSDDDPEDLLSTVFGDGR